MCIFSHPPLAEVKIVDTKIGYRELLCVVLRKSRNLKVMNTFLPDTE